MSIPFHEFSIHSFRSDISPLAVPKDPAKATLLVLWETEEEKSEEMVSFLERILEAAKRVPGQDTLLVMLRAEERIGLAQLLRKWDLQRILVFGIPPERLGLSIRAPLYRHFRLGECTYLWADPLPLVFRERQAGEDKRSRLLWESLQELLKLSE